jgi:D-lactate dehydrogenase (cytochrome)
MPSRIRGRLKHRLNRLVGPEAVLDDPAGIAVYSYDSSLQTGVPAFVVFPESTEQVAEIVKLLHAERIPYVARGAGTNLSGGSVPLREGVVIALSRMRRILEVNPAGQFARVQPGVTNLYLQEALKPHGFFFAPDPASQRVSTIGGNVAENSGGPHCLKYGVTTNHILGLKVVASDGKLVDLGGERLYSPGMDLLGLFVGSEGTLGIATEIICRILPLPRAVRTMLAVYNSTEDAGQTVSDIIAAGIVPATLEMMDNLVIRAVEESLHAGIPTDAEAVLIIEVDGREEALGEVVRRIEDICRRNKVRDIRTARDGKERDILWAGRRGAFGAVARLFPNYLVSDGTVPRTKLPEVLNRVKEIGAKYDLPIGNVFHAGDGNLHPLIFFDARDQNELDRVHRAGKEILVACAKAGGTISGEHGIGTEKIESMALIFRRHEIELMHHIKNVLDPLNLCNPGKILPERTIIYDAEIVPPEDSPGLPAASGEVSGVPVYYPLDADELADALVYFCRNDKSYSAIGADTLFSRLPHRKLPDALISLRPFRSIIDYDPENLTVAAEAGVSLEELQNELRTGNQFLPLDAPPQATLGGIVSAGLPGIRRNLYGSPRDLVLGVRFMDHFGRTFKAGGKTVKNVAGYDYGKLLVGSWGKLSIITEITFRL